MADQLDLFLATEQRTVGRLGRPITTNQQAVSGSQSQHMSAILIGSYWWLHLRQLVVRDPVVEAFCLLSVQDPGSGTP